MFEVIKGDTKKGITPKEQENMKQNQAGRNQEWVYGKMNEFDSGNENSSTGIKIHSGDEINSGLTLSTSDLGDNTRKFTLCFKEIKR